MGFTVGITSLTWPGFTVDIITRLKCLDFTANWNIKSSYALSGQCKLDMARFYSGHLTGFYI